MDAPELTWKLLVGVLVAGLALDAAALGLVHAGGGDLGPVSYWFDRGPAPGGCGPRIEVSTDISRSEMRFNIEEIHGGPYPLAYIDYVFTASDKETVRGDLDRIVEAPDGNGVRWADHAGRNDTVDVGDELVASLGAAAGRSLHLVDVFGDDIGGTWTCS